MAIEHPKWSLIFLATWRRQYIEDPFDDIISCEIHLFLIMKS